MYLGYQNGKIKFYSEEYLNPMFYKLDKQEYTEDTYVYDEEVEEFVLDDEAWQTKQAQKEAERIARLFLTGADVERGIYQAKGMDFDDIMAFVMANPPAGLDVKALKIELKANHFYRGNPYVNAVGGLLGFTPEQLDKFFMDGNYEHLLPVEETLEEVEDEDTTDTTL